MTPNKLMILLYVAIAVIGYCVYQNMRYKELYSDYQQCSAQIQQIKIKSAEQSLKYAAAEKEAQKEVALNKREINAILDADVDPQCERAIKFGIDYAKKVRNG